MKNVLHNHKSLLSFIYSVVHTQSVHRLFFRIDAVVAEKVAEAELKLRDQHQRALDAVRNEAKSQIDKALAEREEFQQLYTKVKFRFYNYFGCF